jgi:hypothetical protein
MDVPYDLELRLVDPAKNRFRLYGLTVCRTLFGELCRAPGQAWVRGMR